MKSGSDGEGASSSQSESSASLGSLKGGGESPTITSLCLRDGKMYSYSPGAGDDDDDDDNLVLVEAPLSRSPF